MILTQIELGGVLIRICNAKRLGSSHFKLLSFERVFYPLLARLDIGAGVEQPFGCLIVQNRQGVKSVGARWIGQWRTTWSKVCSAPHSQAAEEAIPHLYREERKRPTPVRRRLSRTQALLGRVIPGEIQKVKGCNWTFFLL